MSDLTVNSESVDNASNLDRSNLSSIDQSYEELEMDFAQFTKRQKLENDFFFGTCSEKQSEPTRIPSFKRQLPSATDAVDNTTEEFDVDSLLLERNTRY